MNNLIEIKTNNSQEPCVSGRELHKFLGVKEGNKKEHIRRHTLFRSKLAWWASLLPGFDNP